jgi:hypothetical protein
VLGSTRVVAVPVHCLPGALHANTIAVQLFRYRF